MTGMPKALAWKSIAAGTAVGYVLWGADGENPAEVEESLLVVFWNTDEENTAPVVPAAASV